MSLGCAAVISAQQDSASLATVLHRAGTRVEAFFVRAQSLVCLEVVHWIPLTSSWSSQGMSRTMESELRLSWEPDEEGAPSTEAKTLRQLLRVNGRKPYEKDRNNCTDAEQQTSEPQPLSMLLAARRGDYDFTFAGPTRLDNRAALMIDFRLSRKPTVDVKLVEGRDDCVSFDVDGGMQGRLWIDAENYDVLRLDQRLIGMVEIPLPPKIVRFPSAPRHWTLERMDTSIRFRSVSFTNPEEALTLPVSMSSLRITRGSGTPRLRTMTEYTKYQRFMTGGRVVPQ